MRPAHAETSKTRHPGNRVRLVGFAGAVVGFALIAAACGSEGSPTSSSVATGGASSEPRDLWAAQQIDTYHFTMSIEGVPGVTFEDADGLVTEAGCLVDAPFRVTVEDNRVAELSDVMGQCHLEVSDENLAWVPFTIDAVFEFIVHSVDAESAAIRYDSELGYPHSIVDRFIGVGISEFALGLPDRSAREVALAELAAHRSLWEKAGIRDYTFTVLRDVFLPAENRGPFTVTVQGGQVVDVVRPVGNRDLPEHLFTIGRLFSAIERGLDADEITVRYDPEFGYPADIFIDPYQFAIDEEQHYIVSDFQPD